MLDRAAIRVLKPALEGAGRWLAQRGIHADAVTLAGFILGLAAAAAIATGSPRVGLGLIGASRLCDGLDGAVARCRGPTDRGAFLDIVLDFLFYASVPLAFAFADPAANALPAALLLASFIGTGSSFLAFAVMAERRGLTSAAFPAKGLYYLGGLTEAGETLACFALMCLLPQHFGAIAVVFAALCGLTTLARVAQGAALLSNPRR